MSMRTYGSAMKKISHLSVLLFVAGFASAAEISIGFQCFSPTPTCDPVAIQDDGTPLTSTITGSGLPTSMLASDLVLRLFGLQHTYSGDLVVQIRKVLGDLVEPVFYRINRLDPPPGVPDPFDPFNLGSASDFDTASGLNGYYEFQRQGIRDIWISTRLFDGDVDVIDPDISYAPSGVGINTPVAWSLFNGIDPNGEWEIIIQDLETGEFGSIQGWSLSLLVADVPEPSTFGLALGAMAALWLGRRHRAQR
jgi:hypothetical protein